MRRGARRAGLVAAAIVLGATATGCTTDAPASPDVRPTPAANAVTSGITQTRGLGTATVAIETLSERGELVRRGSGEGISVSGNGQGTLTWTDPGGRTVRVLLNGRGAYEQPQGEQSWSFTETPVTVGAAGLLAPLRGLGDLTSVTRQGPDGDRGVRYTATLAATAQGMAQFGLSPTDIAALPPGWANEEVAVTVWLDDGGRVARVDRELPLADGRLTVSTRLSDYRIGVDLTAPPSSLVTARR